MSDFEKEKGEFNAGKEFVNVVLDLTPLRLEKGYEFATRNPMWFGHATCAVESAWSPDSKAGFSHAGIITDSQGGTFEALWTVKESSLDEYLDDYIIISNQEERPYNDKYQALIKVVREHAGQWYPAWRILLHLFGPLAKINWSKRVVCSELVAKYEYYAGMRHDGFSGTTPDRLVDEWRQWKNRQVIEGILKKYDGKYYIKHVESPQDDISWIKHNPVRPAKEDRI